MKLDNKPSQGFEQDFAAVAEGIVQEQTECLGSRLFAVMKLN